MPSAIIQVLWLWRRPWEGRPGLVGWGGVGGGGGGGLPSGGGGKARGGGAGVGGGRARKVGGGGRAAGGVVKTWVWVWVPRWARSRRTRNGGRVMVRADSAVLGWPSQSRPSAVEVCLGKCTSWGWKYPTTGTMKDL